MRSGLDVVRVAKDEGIIADHNILPFPHPHRGDPDPRRMAPASIGFRWQDDMWRRGRVILTDADIDQMDPKRWVQCLRRWTTRRPRARM
jgi:hypothetical protein